ncbi:hypothetical protein [Streptomyces sp. x-80]|uniref:hypothetical protein n=1 Tax=Streptomyces sp. x-80 TaxID=2789282 RepID=UPI00397EF804
MAQNLMEWLIERRVVLEEHARQLRKELADTEAEVARLGAAEVVYQQFQEDAEAGHPDAAAWQQALEEATGGEPAVPAQGVGATPGAAGQLLIPHRTDGSDVEDLPADYRQIMGIVASGAWGAPPYSSATTFPTSGSPVVIRHAYSATGRLLSC